MKITILCVGKIKERFYKDAILEYTKRLSRYCKLTIVEVADERIPDHPSAGQIEQVRKLEGKRLMRHLADSGYVIALAIEGQQPDSVELSEKIDGLALRGISQICLVIGGSLGLSGEVLRRADEKLSFSRMTFPHQLVRVILLEQLYRSFRIINHEPYHK